MGKGRMCPGSGPRQRCLRALGRTDGGIQADLKSPTDPAFLVADTSVCLVVLWGCVSRRLGPGVTAHEVSDLCQPLSAGLVSMSLEKELLRGVKKALLEGMLHPVPP